MMPAAAAAAAADTVGIEIEQGAREMPARMAAKDFEREIRRRAPELESERRAEERAGRDAMPREPRSRWTAAIAVLPRIAPIVILAAAFLERS